MITIERLGVRKDGNPVVETSTYIPAAPDHPLAMTLAGVEGHWVLLAVGNSLKHAGAREVTKAEFNSHKSAIAELVEARLVEAQEVLDMAAAVREAKKADVEAELESLGLSAGAISAILDGVKG